MGMLRRAAARETATGALSGVFWLFSKLRSFGLFILGVVLFVIVCVVLEGIAETLAGVAETPLYLLLSPEWLRRNYAALGWALLGLLCFVLVVTLSAATVAGFKKLRRWQRQRKGSPDALEDFNSHPTEGHKREGRGIRVARWLIRNTSELGFPILKGLAYVAGFGLFLAVGFVVVTFIDGGYHALPFVVQVWLERSFFALKILICGLMVIVVVAATRRWAEKPPKHIELARERIRWLRETPADQMSMDELLQFSHFLSDYSQEADLPKPLLDELWQIVVTKANQQLLRDFPLSDMPAEAAAELEQLGRERQRRKHREEARREQRG
jgi:hypothetical protein